ncbi:unnamed protein product, partial [Mesorhabditis spiculigera]
MYLPNTEDHLAFTIAMQQCYYPICGVLIFLTLLVNLYTAYKLFTHTKALTKRELRFHITTLAQFAAQMVNTIELLVVNALRVDDSYIVFRMQPTIADITNLLPLWVLLLLSEETRIMVTGKSSVPKAVAVVSVAENPLKA